MIGDKNRKLIPWREGRKPTDFFRLSCLGEADFLPFFFFLVKADMEHEKKKTKNDLDCVVFFYCIYEEFS